MYNDYKYGYNPDQAIGTMDNYQFNRWAEQNPTAAANAGIAGYEVNSNNLSGPQYADVTSGNMFGEGGLSMQGLGGLASNVGSVVGLISSLNNVFGGKSDLEKAQLNYLNQTSSGLAEQLAEQKRRNTEFRADRDRITSSYMGS